MMDRFANRILIPIHDAYGNPVGFTARRLDDRSQEAKYINTAETTHLSERKAAVQLSSRQRGGANSEKRVFLAEGAMDVLAFEKADMHNGAGDAGHFLHRKSSCSC